MSVQSAADAVLTTTIKLPARLRAELDVVRAERTRRTGERPANNDLLVEAVREFVARENQTGRTK
jgi:predicted transcriptional regulator